MRSGFKIGRLFGIDIRLDWSWLLILVLVTWNLSAVFGNTHPDWGPGLTWGVAIIAALLFFGSVLAHELAHSLVARARGIPVRNITLFLFGGVSNIQREPPSAGIEFVMAIVGPLTSVVLGVLLLVIGGLGTGTLSQSISDPNDVVAQLNPLTTLLIWLGSVNILVGLFNMIPAFPLDGGRVVRSALWAAIDDLKRATRWASWLGQGIAWLMIVAGVSMIFGLNVP
ncbi:MAG: site-2 protease family protein, partial [Anaerolineae bacterium]